MLHGIRRPLATPFFNAVLRQNKELSNAKDCREVLAMRSISGSSIKRLMRRHKVTISDLAKRMQITMKRVREVREKGVEGHCMCLDWYEAITLKGIFAPTPITLPTTNTFPTDQQGSTHKAKS